MRPLHLRLLTLTLHYTNDQHVHGTHTERYSKSAARAEGHACPIVAILLPAARNRFADLLKSINDVRHLTAHDIASYGLDACQGGHRCSSDVTVVHLRLAHMARGLRPDRVPKRAHRVRVGRDSSMSDLVSALNQQGQHDCICFDFGGELHHVRFITYAPEVLQNGFVPIYKIYFSVRSDNFLENVA